jgi:UDP-N-acetylmuramoyl-L-alanyl-D-glutamate--2,6-diaminopimelate ligase
MMRLSSLLEALPGSEAPPRSQRSGPSLDPTIRGVRIDSRSVSPGDLFVALRGENSDGHAFLGDAIASGAAALLVEDLPSEPSDLPIPCVRVSDTRRALAPIAARFFGQPARELTLIGVTGTNGKTSTTYLIESILAHADQRVGLVGTVEIRYDGCREDTVNTTPESLELQRTLRAMRNHGIDAAVMEVSSHGLELGRVEGCAFRVAAFTNLSQDHLDFHGDMDTYLASKARLFRDYLDADAVAVINVDDPVAETLIEIARGAGARILRVGRGAAAKADLRLVDHSIRLEGTQATLEDAEGTLEISSSLIGDFNLENLLVATGVARGLGLPHDVIAEGIASCPQVPGRMERVEGTGRSEPTVLVDYAHTPDAVDKLLRAVRPLCRGRLITVFGCGGDRDRTKRPLMARAVAKHADRAIATSDNPRTEDPSGILEDVVSGLDGLENVAPQSLFDASGDAARYCVLVDRKEAIDLAILGASADDTVVLAGKGHEDYQILGRRKFPFDDRREARRALLSRGVASGGVA